MLAYLAKCVAILLALWFIRYLHWLPWSNWGNLVLMVVVPTVLIAVGAWRSEHARRQAEEQSADAALSAVESRLIRRL